MEKEIKNIVAERIVIGCLLNHPDWLVRLNGIIRRDNFFAVAHKVVFHILYLLFQDENIEVIDTMAILARAEKIEKASDVLNDNGGFEYIETIKELSINYNFEEFKTYCKDVVTSSYKREQICLLERMIEKIKQENMNTIADIDHEIQQSQQELNQRYNSGGDVKVMKDKFEETWQEIEESRSENGIVGLPSKIPLVNEYYTYQNSELTIIGCRAKYGKSMYGINEVHNLSVNMGIPVGYFDTEMKTRIFLLRILSIDSGVPITEIQTGEYLNNIDKIMAVEASKERIKKAPIFHHYDHDWDLAKVKNKAKLLKIKHGIGLLIYDYIKVMEVKSTTKEHAELGNWTIGLKNLAGELDIPIITFGQLSPNEIRLADSDKLNRYATTIAYMLPKTQEQIKRDFGAEQGGKDYIYVDYNRIGKSMSEPDKGINVQYTREIATIKQAQYQILKDDYM